jgi:hypothetical protein
MALKPNQRQVTTINLQANAIIERLHKVVKDMRKSFDLENNHENLEEQENKKMIHLSTSFNQLHGSKILEVPIIQQCRQHHANLCLAEI